MTPVSATADDAGVTLVEVLLTLLIVTLVAGVLAMTALRGSSVRQAGAAEALAFLRSARATAILSGEPTWLAVSNDSIADQAGSSAVKLAPQTIVSDPDSAFSGSVVLLVRPDGSVIGPRLWIAVGTAFQELFVWSPQSQGEP